ncbi:serine/threonine-protein phosphatase 7 long form homolog isoform X1 [Miscanthus floridulus]|uniref:serine/threonine-protein phosphatase 7 long form homolog isoform X1 n=1 Tax=Miscanthus floridulus TaxID=154761 RepID=UPI00345AA1DD
MLSTTVFRPLIQHYLVQLWTGASAFFDVKAILGLRLGGLLVTDIVDNDHWRELVAQFTGFLPPNGDAFKKNKKSSGVSSSWITERFEYLDPQAEEAQIDRFARVWLWHFLGAFLFPDASGNTISWIFLDTLRQPWENIAGYSWGNAVLAWTCRQLCVACRRTSGHVNLGGCSYLLQVWCWERLSVGRPLNNGLPQWNGHDTLPTAMYIWTESQLVRGNMWRKYREYTNGLDVLTRHQVFWCPWDSPELQDYLSPVTRDESHEYRCDVPLIFFHVVEIHLPIRVCRQLEE